ncbi:MAG: L-rhamnose mutarotase [Pirellulales bacterium]
MRIRKAFVMSVNPGAEEEYEKRHNPIWPELQKVRKDHGVSKCSTFLGGIRLLAPGFKTILCAAPELGGRLRSAKG